MNWAGVLVIAIGLLVASGGQAHAKSSYLSSFNSTYGTSGTALNSCNLCHAWRHITGNSYGQAMLAPGSSITIRADGE